MVKEKHVEILLCIAGFFVVLFCLRGCVDYDNERPEMPPNMADKDIQLSEPDVLKIADDYMRDNGFEVADLLQWCSGPFILLRQKDNVVADAYFCVCYGNESDKTDNTPLYTVYVDASSGNIVNFTNARISSCTDGYVILSHEYYPMPYLCGFRALLTYNK